MFRGVPGVFLVLQSPVISGLLMAQGVKRMLSKFAWLTAVI